MFADKQKQAAKYRRCMQMAGGRVVRMQSRRSRQQGSRVVTPVTDRNKIADYCGYRFGERPPERIEQCRRLLAHETNATLLGLRPEIAQQFEAYNWCFQSYRLRVDAHCTDILQKAIADRRLRATKITRATMDSMEPLLRALPTLRIIHLVRDPRAVAPSRYRPHSVPQEQPWSVYGTCPAFVSVYPCCRGITVLQSRDRRHPVSTGARTRVSGSHNVGQI